jgi:hypothetical protein
VINSDSKALQDNVYRQNWFQNSWPIDARAYASCIDGAAARALMAGDEDRIPTIFRAKLGYRIYAAAIRRKEERTFCQDPNKKQK